MRKKRKEVDLRKNNKKSLIISSVLLAVCLAGMIVIGELNAR